MTVTLPLQQIAAPSGLKSDDEDDVEEVEGEEGVEKSVEVEATSQKSEE